MAIDNKWQRLALMLDDNQISKLINATVMVVGIGGVGAMCVEALCRSAIGKLIIIDNDKIENTNLNRQIMTTSFNINEAKTKIMKERVLSINPDCEVVAYNEFFDKNKEYFFNDKIDFVVDAIDTISSKIDLIEICQKRNIPIISSLGMGNRFDPSALRYTTLDKTTDDPLARSMRQLARKRGIDLKVTVVVSTEKPIKLKQIINDNDQTTKEKNPPASNAFVPNAAGLLLASYVIKELIK